MSPLPSISHRLFVAAVGREAPRRLGETPNQRSVRPQRVEGGRAQEATLEDGGMTTQVNDQAAPALAREG
jgi:hypothetical protein